MTRFFVYCCTCRNVIDLEYARQNADETYTCHGCAK